MNQQFALDAKRAIKGLRNAFIDPLPRRRALNLVAADPVADGVAFAFEAGKRSYTVRLVLGESLAVLLRERWNLPQVQQALLAIGAALSARFFPLTDFGEVRISAFSLDDRTVQFFERFFVDGLAEFRFLNGLDPSRRVLVRGKRDEQIKQVPMDTEDRVLMLNGGGKDTIVAAELLRAAGQDFAWLSIGPNLSIRREVVAASGMHEAIEVSVEMDASLARDRVYSWGHTPFVSMVLSIGLLVAMLARFRYVVVGNELSANFGNVRHRGMEINHQYTKSAAYEADFGDFVSRRVTESIQVFSILRPFHDLQLAELFAAQGAYFGKFVSCNNPRNGEWCRRCPKCAFTALALAPFMPAKALEDAFGEDIFSRPEIRKHVLDLVAGAIKPWECVGTRDECTLALGLMLARNPSLDFAEYPRRADLEAAVAGIDLEMLRVQILESTSREHRIPPELIERINRGLSVLSGNRLRIERPHVA